MIPKLSDITNKTSITNLDKLSDVFDERIIQRTRFPFTYAVPNQILYVPFGSVPIILPHGEEDIAFLVVPFVLPPMEEVDDTIKSMIHSCQTKFMRANMEKKPMWKEVLAALAELSK